MGDIHMLNEELRNKSRLIIDGDFWAYKKGEYITKIPKNDKSFLKMIIKRLSKTYKWENRRLNFIYDNHYLLYEEEYARVMRERQDRKEIKKTLKERLEVLSRI